MTIHRAHLNKAINWHVDLTHICIVCYLPSLCYSIINLLTVINNYILIRPHRYGDLPET